MILLLVFIFFFTTRITNLTLLPLFNDESIYINFGQRMIEDSNNRFYSLFDGKQPLLMWLFGISSNIFSDPAYAGRLISVIFSTTTFFGLYFISRKFLSKPYFYIPLIIYTITPVFLFFDRQALMEGPLNAISIWSLYFLVKLMETKKMRFAFFLGTILGLGLFIKSTAILFVITSIFYLLYLAFKNKKKTVPYILVVLITAVVVLFPLITNPQFSIILSRGDRFNLTLAEMAKFPFFLWTKNMFDFITISFWQLTPPIFTLSLIGIVLFIKEKKGKILIFWFLLPLIISIITARGFNPRYAEALLPITVVFTAYSVYYFFRIIPILIPTALISILLIFNPLVYFNVMDRLTPLFSQKHEYVTDDTSGYGIKEAVSFLNEKSQNSPIIVGVRLDAGNPENAILAYFYKNPAVQATYFDKQMFSKDFDFKLLKPQFPVYYVSRSQHQGGLESYLVEEKRFYKPGEKSFIGVYRFDNNQ
ncbi:glycosyltransferase family 39 protein [Candidatus Gottesmanbacteria bacterium]|nr:glycosyltransferase family 39 protein [Candidatus Gottesmanbacteria bacterium]